MSDISKGDIVVCINTEEIMGFGSPKLTIGKKYTIDIITWDITSQIAVLYWIVNDLDIMIPYPPKRFELLKTCRNKVINNILE